MGFNRKALGRWGEGCVTRLMRDLNWCVMSQAEEMYAPGRDLQIYKGLPNQPNYKKIHLQVKATSKNYNEGFKLHFSQVNKICKWAEQANVVCHLVAVSHPRKMIELYPHQYVLDVRDQALQAKGDVVSMPGMLLFEYEHAKMWPLTDHEIHEGARIISGPEETYDLDDF